MNYRIEKKNAFQVIYKRQKVEKPGSDMAAKDIYGFWVKCSVDGTMTLQKNEKYKYANGVELEIYPSDQVENPDYTCGIWIAVRGK